MVERGPLLRIIVEPPQDGFVHACTVDDVVEVFSHLPPEDRAGLNLIVLRQPKRKERICSAAWGRVAFFMEFARHSGGAVILEAIQPGAKIKWTRKLRPESQAELARLHTLGLEPTLDRRSLTFETTVAGARSVLLYHTLLHEVGHFQDFLRLVERPRALAPDGNDDRLWDRYWARPEVEREEYAHRYSDRLRARLSAAGVIPFDRKLDPVAISRDGLAMRDFTLP